MTSATMLSTKNYSSTSDFLRELVLAMQAARVPTMTDVDADLLQRTMDDFLSDSEIAALARIARQHKAPEALEGLFKNLLNMSLSPRTVARNTMVLFDTLCKSYYYSARATDYRKIHRVIAGFEEDLMTFDESEMRDIRRIAIANLHIHV